LQSLNASGKTNTFVQKNCQLNLAAKTDMFAAGVNKTHRDRIFGHSLKGLDTKQKWGGSWGMNHPG